MQEETLRVFAYLAQPSGNELYIISFDVKLVVSHMPCNNSHVKDVFQRSCAATTNCTKLKHAEL